MVFSFAVIPACLFVWNLFFYRKAAAAAAGASVSILIPARNEEGSIEASVRAALASLGVELEVIVLDDHSEDGTAEIVGRIVPGDARVRLVSAPPLPGGWCGKQFACSVLAQEASKSTLCFIDADVRLAPDGLTRMIEAMRTRKASVMSGFPWQETGTFFERLLLPLMHFLLLGYLPMIGMRKTLHPAFGAGCGQLFVADREAYRLAGGHTAIRNSRHDGITLPRAFRAAGFKTDLCDATDIASCRMYSNAHEVFHGLLKNATEGIASAGRILPFSLLLFGGQVMPVVMLLWGPQRILAGVAVILSYLPRLIAAIRFRQPILAALLHPIAVLVLLGIQWLAFVRLAFGFPSTWKGRNYSTT